MCTEETVKNFNKCYVLNGILQKERIGMENVHGVAYERRHSSWARFPNEFGNLQEHKIREHRERRNSECESPQIFITIMDEINFGQRSNDQIRQKLVSTLIPFYVLVGWSKVQEPQKEDGKAKLKISGCIHHIKMLWESMEKQLNSSGTFSQDFRRCLFFMRSIEIWKERASNQRTSRTGSSSCQCSMTFCVNMESTVTRIPVTTEPKRLVNGPCWNLF